MGADTIAAVSTPLASGGLGVVRISGPEALSCGDKIFRPYGNRKLSSLGGYQAAYGEIFGADGVIDECVALVFRAPRSYTREDVVELSCHGGVYVMRAVLRAALAAGARLAQPGEFTRRAFLNGRIDLTRAEAVMEIISARGELAAKAAQSQREGAMFKKAQELKRVLVDISADISAFVDFPDEDVPGLEPDVLRGKLTNISQALGRCADSYGRGKILREGVPTVIAGRPNVGKSTLMNLISGAERSIVTSVPGTTRDLVEESVTFGDAVLVLTDTAGLREAGDEVEKIGVARAKDRIASAQLVFAVFDASRCLTDDDEKLIAKTDTSRTVAVLNKCDLCEKIDEEYIRSKYKYTVKLSAKNGEGLDELENAVRELLGTARIDPGEPMAASERQLENIRAAKDGADAALEALDEGMTLDAVSTGVEQATREIMKLTGESASQEVIDRVFEKFCVGK